jgi:hypothetical protein
MPFYSTRQELFCGITTKIVSGKKRNKIQKTINNEMTKSDTSPAKASG